MSRLRTSLVIISTVTLVSIVIIICFKFLFPIKKDEPKFVCGTCENEMKNPKHHSAIIHDSLFMRYCSSCHYANDRRSTGPGLQGILLRIPSLDWVHSFIHDPNSMIKSGDAYSVKIFNENNHCSHPGFPELTDEQIDRILSLCNNNGY